MPSISTEPDAATPTGKRRHYESGHTKRDLTRLDDIWRLDSPYSGAILIAGIDEVTGLAPVLELPRSSAIRLLKLLIEELIPGA